MDDLARPLLFQIFLFGCYADLNLRLCQLATMAKQSVCSACKFKPFSFKWYHVWHVLSKIRYILGTRYLAIIFSKFALRFQLFKSNHFISCPKFCLHYLCKWKQAPSNQKRWTWILAMVFSGNMCPLTNGTTFYRRHLCGIFFVLHSNNPRWTRCSSYNMPRVMRRSAEHREGTCRKIEHERLS